MATWRLVKPGYVVSSEGRSLSCACFSHVYRYDTAKGWIDLSTDLFGKIEDLETRIYLPVSNLSHWRSLADAAGAPITEDDIVEMKTDIEAANTAWGGGRISFVDNAAIY